MAKLPFRMMPGSWGLRGKTRAVAEAEYYYEGTELTKKLAEIEAEGDPVQSELIILESKLKAGELSHPEYEKECANAQGEPYVNVLDMGIDPENVANGYFELDYNDLFVKMLTEHGIVGKSDEEIVNIWFNRICRTIVAQETADLDYGLQEAKTNLFVDDVEYVNRNTSQEETSSSNE
jgi:hypothetical protein